MIIILNTLKKLTEQLFGKIYADKGYLSKTLWEMLFEDGMQLPTKVRKNMRGRIMELKDKIFSCARTESEIRNRKMNEVRFIFFIVITALR